ncbi:hypothetical protein LK536_26475 [Lachnoclostridium pacaense]|uniref:hypothetical protein n=1 Tax=Enterocloster hominis (ex Hitch et al. 2024) TaxID=1917870 RepID=UPI001D10FA72|nr:hypothetical protein [Lachnoclostridium pacaense]MCC2879801.1 hypothetical protein [Lachnoclostridium pacaense]
MREILNYPPIEKTELETVKALMNRIAEATSDENCSRELSELNRITGKLHEAIEFAEYWGWTDLDTLAEKVLTAEPPYINDLTKDDIAEIVSMTKTCLLSGEDNKADYYMELLHKSLPLTDVMRYIMSEKDEETIVNDMIKAASNSVIAL